MRCPVTYEETNYRYSEAGLKIINRSLKELHELPYTKDELRIEAAARSEKMSIQGVQPKLPARLNVKGGVFELTNGGGQYILKPQSADYPELPENEDLTMRLAKSYGLDVPLHFMIYGKDGALTYVIKRFDRAGKNRKLSVEDFAQLSGATRDTKYRSSMEQVAKIIEKYCTFPQIEKEKLFKLTLFSFITGNEDMHLKNFSLIYEGGKVQLSPVYDLLNTTAAVPNPIEELALPLNAKKNRITKADLADYYGKERLGLNEKVIDKALSSLESVSAGWGKTIEKSFLSAGMKEKYLKLLTERRKRLF
ncbi:type II toxin-antitoxin system HipA family toxin [Geovibrio thiophilus]|uniref:Type II toxin-antitoxin system HipA family toxin n=1 Tax=Geovibrio thiophilus TaxID=139438 RepID=A0A410JW27_9BACT|nr:HipA domain-containing protein [Geovibrio thiophilus]QAR32407.1 type II toxin-antitoxin system HipA family toxin [Geovibrio thiophilus]